MGQVFPGLSAVPQKGQKQSKPGESSRVQRGWRPSGGAAFARWAHPSVTFVWLLGALAQTCVDPQEEKSEFLTKAGPALMMRCEEIQ